MLLEPQLRNEFSGFSRPTAIPVCQELLPDRFILEHVEDAGGSRDGAGFESRFDVLTQLAVGVELLKRAPPCEYAVPELHLVIAPSRHDNLGGHDERFPTKLPGSPQSVRPLARLFDDVDDVPQIHHIRRPERFVRTKRRVPPAAFDAVACKNVEILTVPAAVIKYGRGRLYETIS